MKHCEHCIMQDCDWCNEMPRSTPQSRTDPSPTAHGLRAIASNQHQPRMNISSGEDAFINTVNYHDYTRTQEAPSRYC